ncbi:hypothetical protein FISHEDRAFT_51981 [Fistulina hepatica ATCC 64428]|nr:hypothetical protein FISHEDRAFT_51981 [Fistulina hepatica ATCC 64428]
MKHSASSGERQSQFQNGHSDALYGTQQPAVRRTQILMLGLRRSGKSSIQQVLFNNMPPLHTFHLEPTRRIIKVQYDSIIPLEIWDCPGNLTPDTLDAPLSHFSSMIFVIDIRDLYNQAITRLVDWLVASINQNPNMNFEVFVHKTERLPEDDKMENFRQIHERVSDRLAEIGPPYDAYNLNFQFTSVYDHTIHEAFSRVLHKLINSLPYLEDLLNVFCANSLASKAFLFDIKSRLHVATDASPVDALTHGLCCDWLTMLNQFGDLYKFVLFFFWVAFFWAYSRVFQTVSEIIGAAYLGRCKGHTIF